METHVTRLPSWMRALSVIFGIIAIAGALLVLADPALGVSILIIFLSVGLLFMGIDRLVTGISGNVTTLKVGRKLDVREGTSNA